MILGRLAIEQKRRAVKQSPGQILCTLQSILPVCLARRFERGIQAQPLSILAAEMP